MIVSDTWSSIVVMIKEEILPQLQAAFPDDSIQLHDWEAHANMAELPNKDLVGPMTLGITEGDPGMYEISFAIGISTYTNDEGLFRMRYYADRVFDRLKYGNKINFLDAETGMKRGVFVLVDGTMLAPMSRADVRAFQYIQCVMLLNPNPD